ncbi:reverse transcriptase zinc-binding domain-containing protein [Artemisia annua]|uniref:Reverse transcriptase zinc-binding domain-containing protein n=1 Tax=Artemisia annua TaxID=35608 RepID=A0A2U1LPS7_ARTAN|nr:reverse transcriptase zinc-binding domain-containing protein [Artemisia annua]
MDRMTASICEKPYGKATFARVLVEIDSEIPLVGCEDCKIFGHYLSDCQNKVNVARKVDKDGENVKPSEGKVNVDEGWSTAGNQRNKVGGNNLRQGNFGSYQARRGVYVNTASGNNTSNANTGKKGNKDVSQKSEPVKSGNIGSVDDSVVMNDKGVPANKGKGKVDEGISGGDGNRNSGNNVNKKNEQKKNLGNKNSNKNGNGSFSSDGRNSKDVLGSKNVSTSNHFDALGSEQDSDNSDIWNDVKSQVDKACNSGIPILEGVVKGWNEDMINGNNDNKKNEQKKNLGNKSSNKNGNVSKSGDGSNLKDVLGSKNVSTSNRFDVLGSVVKGWNEDMIKYYTEKWNSRIMMNGSPEQQLELKLKSLSNRIILLNRNISVNAKMNAEKMMQKSVLTSHDSNDVSLSVVKGWNEDMIKYYTEKWNSRIMMNGSPEQQLELKLKSLSNRIILLNRNISVNAKMNAEKMMQKSVLTSHDSNDVSLSKCYDEAYRVELAKSIWDNLKILCKLDNVSCIWAEIVSGISIRTANNSLWSVIQRLVFGAAVYYIWQERNLRLFEKKFRSEEAVFKIIVDIVRHKLLSLRITQSVDSVNAAVIWKIPLMSSNGENNRNQNYDDNGVK